MGIMDQLDQKLITLLRHNGRRSISDLAEETGTSRATVRARMERLEKSGAVLGYTVVLRSDALEQAVRGIVLIEIKGQAADKVVDTLSGFSEVTAVHTTNGKWDLIAEVGADSLAELDAILRKFRLIPGISGSETNLLLATPMSTRARL
jgi:DNA-binding Lrp family transcriptional regulator